MKLVLYYKNNRYILQMLNIYKLYVDKTITI